MSGQIGRPAARDRAAYFTAAYSLLGERGYNAFTIQAVCSRLGVTKGAFYHQFGDLPTFVEMFATEWQTWLSERYEQFASEADPRRRLEVIANGAFVTMTPGVQAMCAWARTNPTIAEAVSAFYRGAIALGEDTMATLAEDDDTGQVLATMAITMWAGIQLRPRPLRFERFMQLLAVLFDGAGVQNNLFRLGDRTYLKVLPTGRLQPVVKPPTTIQNHLPISLDPPTAALWLGLDGRNSTRGRYFAAAGELLGERGSDALTIAALVQRLELTKGSFHHHFGCFPAFVDQLTRAWENAELARIDQFMTEPDPLRRMELLLADLLVGPDSTQTAWRAWGHTDVVVRQALRRVDSRLQRALVITLAQLGDAPTADWLGEMTLGLALGLRSLPAPPHEALTQRVALEWMRRMVGVDAEIRTDTGVPTLALRAA